MAANLPYTGRPKLYTGFSFTDPNDPGAIRVWHDFTSSWRAANAIGRGNDYELGQAVSGQPTFLFRDPSELLNPDNTSGPYAGLLDSYRPFCLMGTWPQSAAGTILGNLINTNAWRVPMDSTFESYANGQTLSWVTGYGVTPAVTTTNPHGGTKALAWTIGGTVSGNVLAGFPLYTVPGTQYTVSAWVRQTAVSTLQVGMGGCTGGADRFNRVTASGWGSADDVGGAWTVVGTASDYSTTAGSLSAYGTGNHKHTATNTAHLSYLNTAAFLGPDVDATSYVTCPVVATGAAIRQGVMGRLVPATPAFYAATLDFNTDQTVTLSLIRSNAGTDTVITSSVLPYTYVAGSTFGVRLTVVGTALTASAWPRSTPRPTTATITATDTTITGSAPAGCYSKLLTGNTNGTTTVTFAQYNNVITRLGSSTIGTGAYAQVTLTFTADQPQHTFYVGSWLGSPANTVTVDDLRMEEGASATANAGSPVVYPIFSGYAERFIRTYDAQGYLGMASVVCVDALAAVQAISIDTEYVEALRATGPAFWWQLNENFNAVTFSDHSGNGGPALVMYPSKNGAGTAPSPGSGLNVVGDPAGTGVAFTFPGLGAKTGTVLGYGQVVNFAQGFAFPNYGPSSWAATAACWVVCQSTGDAQVLVLPVTNNTFSPLAAEGISLGIDGIHNKFDPFVSGATGTNDIFNQGPVITDGKPHLLVATATQVAGGNTTLTAYVDGTQIGTSTVTTASLGGIATVEPTSIVVGGYFAHTAYQQIVNGSLAHVALWNRALSAAEVTTLWTAGGLGDTGELSGTRVARHLALGQYQGATRISTGSSIMGPPSFSRSIRLADDCRNTTVAEGGCLWAAPDGALVFEGRQDRWLRLTPLYTFGENISGGELPYEGDITFSRDPQYLFGDVEITQQPSGSIAIGGRQADIATATLRQFGKAFGANVDLQNIADVQSLADWIFYTHNRGISRVARLTVTPARSTSTLGDKSWQTALSVEVGNRVRAVRRAKAANSGAGITITLDFFVEAVTHDNIDMDTGQWDTWLLLSPIGSATVGNGLTFQPWILGDATLGVLGSTTVLGW